MALLLTRSGAVALLGAAAFGASFGIGAPAAAAQSRPSDPDTSAITPAMVAAGRASFRGEGTCFACHGMRLEGTAVAPTLLAHTWKDAKNGEFGEIIRVVTTGVPGTAMVAFPGGISRAQAIQIAAYIWSVDQGRAKP